ncbi:amino acid permease [Pseudomonas typographi]|uniref:amino acid permease n=1 Tax=Pseudomonas typographi TaxID=2715964 RepID=UPI00168418B5|nr:amino acid permease [Pseudomonas typographi]MBD1551694.1 amino acid permease [Pseudomonas typographi]
MHHSEKSHHLATRHVTMISIGGVIGATLFVGSGSVVMHTGPAAIISYLLGGIIIILAMRMLGEMAAVKPAKGSFSTYAKDAFGPWAGFTIGWLYWAVWAITIAYEVSLLGYMVHQWIPQLSIGLAAFLILASMTWVNIASVRNFGNFEYVLSLIKVVAIVAFLLVGASLLLGLITPATGAVGWSNWSAPGSFFPKGYGAVFASLVLVIFSTGGSEVAAIAASESEHPQKNVLKAINSTVSRVILFYVGSVFVIITVIPWDNSALLKAPFVSVFQIAGIDWAGAAMQAVIFIAILSVTNSGIYTAARMLTALAEQNNAPSYCKKYGSRGTPTHSIVATVAIAFLLALVNTSAFVDLFTFLANCTGGILILVYIFIAASHVVIRKRNGEGSLAVKMWLFPGLSYVFIALCIALYISQAFIDSLSVQFYCTTGFLVFVLAGWGVKKSLSKKYGQVAETANTGI